MSSRLSKSTQFFLFSLMTSGLASEMTIADVIVDNATDVVVIVHPSNISEIDKNTLKKIFMGRVKTFPDGNKAIPIDLESGNVKKVFLQKYLQKDQGALDSYWSRMLFTGAGTPPKVFKSDEDIKSQVAGNPYMIGFIDSAKVDKTVRVLTIKN